MNFMFYPIIVHVHVCGLLFNVCIELKTVDGLIFVGYSFSWFFVEGLFCKFQCQGNSDFLYES